MKSKSRTVDDPELSRKKMSRKEINCKICGVDIVVSGDVGKITCWKCVSQLVAPPEEKKSSSKRPRGWHKKQRYVDKDGHVYAYGRLTDEIDVPGGQGCDDPDDSQDSVAGCDESIE